MCLIRELCVLRSDSLARRWEWSAKFPNRDLAKICALGPCDSSLNSQPHNALRRYPPALRFNETTMTKPLTRILRAIEEKGDETVTEDFEVISLERLLTSSGVRGTAQSLRCMGMYG